MRQFIKNNRPYAQTSREDGTSRLQYVNNSDNVVITDVNA